MPDSPDTRGKGGTSKRITHGFHLVKGKSNHAMEDCLVCEFKQVNNNELGLFAIYDGHMGHDVANYLQTNLFNNILKEVMHNLKMSSHCDDSVLTCFCYVPAKSCWSLLSFSLLWYYHSSYSILFLVHLLSL